MKSTQTSENILSNSGRQTPELAKKMASQTKSKELINNEKMVNFNGKESPKQTSPIKTYFKNKDGITETRTLISELPILPLIYSKMKLSPPKESTKPTSSNIINNIHNTNILKQNLMPEHQHQQNSNHKHTPSNTQNHKNNTNNNSPLNVINQKTPQQITKSPNKIMKPSDNKQTQLNIEHETMNDFQKMRNCQQLFDISQSKIDDSYDLIGIGEDNEPIIPLKEILKLRQRYIKIIPNPKASEKVSHASKLEPNQLKNTVAKTMDKVALELKKLEKKEIAKLEEITSNNEYSNRRDMKPKSGRSQSRSCTATPIKNRSEDNIFPSIEKNKNSRTQLFLKMENQEETTGRFTPHDLNSKMPEIRQTPIKHRTKIIKANGNTDYSYSVPISSTSTKKNLQKESQKKQNHPHFRPRIGEVGYVNKTAEKIIKNPIQFQNKTLSTTQTKRESSQNGKTNPQLPLKPKVPYTSKRSEDFTSQKKMAEKSDPLEEELFMKNQKNFSNINIIHRKLVNDYQRTLQNAITDPRKSPLIQGVSPQKTTNFQNGVSPGIRNEAGLNPENENNIKNDPINNSLLEETVGRNKEKFQKNRKSKSFINSITEKDIHLNTDPAHKTFTNTPGSNHPLFIPHNYDPSNERAESPLWSDFSPSKQTSQKPAFKPDTKIIPHSEILYPPKSPSLSKTQIQINNRKEPNFLANRDIGARIKKLTEKAALDFRSLESKNEDSEEDLMEEESESLSDTDDQSTLDKRKKLSIGPTKAYYSPHNDIEIWKAKLEKSVLQQEDSETGQSIEDAKTHPDTEKDYQALEYLKQKIIGGDRLPDKPIFSPKNMLSPQQNQQNQQNQQHPEEARALSPTHQLSLLSTEHDHPTQSPSHSKPSTSNPVHGFIRRTNRSSIDAKDKDSANTHSSNSNSNSNSRTNTNSLLGTLVQPFDNYGPPAHQRIYKYIAKSPFKPTGTGGLVNPRSKHETKIAALVKKGVCDHVTLLSSVYKGRPSTVFFPYPKCCQSVRPMSRVYIVSKAKIASFSMSLTFAISETTHVYNCVVNALKNAGFSPSKSSDWNLLWTSMNKTVDILKDVNKFQKCNHFPGVFQIGRKDNLCRNISRLRRVHKYQYDICPQTYLLPEDFNRFNIDRANDHKNSLWILKPNASSCGRGIKLIGKKTLLTRKTGYVASKYISNPHLIDGYKYDLRLYVLVSCFDPLTIYLFNNGLVRFATEKFSINPKNLKSKFIHLTNYSINRFNENYNQNDLDYFEENYDPEDISKWDLVMLKNKYISLGINYTKIFEKIKDIIIKSLITIEPHVVNNLTRLTKFRNQCFDVYGFDIIIDQNLRPWLLEVNVCPSLSSSSKLDKKIKTTLMCDAFNLIGMVPYDRVLHDKEVHAENQRRLLGNHKGCFLAGKYMSKNVADLKYLSLGKEGSLSEDDVRTLINHDEENYRRGNFEKIFPLKSNWKMYSQFFECERYNNYLVGAWLDSAHNYLEKYYKKIHFSKC